MAFRLESQSIQIVPVEYPKVRKVITEKKFFYFQIKIQIMIKHRIFSKFKENITSFANGYSILIHLKDKISHT